MGARRARSLRKKAAGARALGEELARLTAASIPVDPADGPELSARKAGIATGALVGGLERAFVCAKGADLDRAQVNRTAALLIRSAKAYGLTEGLAGEEDVARWVDKQGAIPQLAMP